MAPSPRRRGQPREKKRPCRLAAPALTHGLDRVEEQELPRSAGAALRDRIEERPWLGQRAVLARVDEIDARVRLCELRRLPNERDEGGGRVERRFGCDSEKEGLHIGSIVGRENNVVSPEEPVERTIQVVHPRRCGRPGSGLLHTRVTVTVKHCLPTIPDASRIAYT